MSKSHFQWQFKSQFNICTVLWSLVELMLKYQLKLQKLTQQIIFCEIGDIQVISQIIFLKNKKLASKNAFMPAKSLKI